jgi:hypothetical protein
MFKIWKFCLCFLTLECPTAKTVRFSAWRSCRSTAGSSRRTWPRTRPWTATPWPQSLLTLARSTVCTLAYTCIHLRTLAYTCVHLRTLAYTCVHLRTLAYTCVHLHTLAYTCVHLRTLAYTCVHLHTLAYTCEVDGQNFRRRILYLFFVSSWGQCYDHYFWPFLLLFGEKIALFLSW